MLLGGIMLHGWQALHRPPTQAPGITVVMMADRRGLSLVVSMPWACQHWFFNCTLDTSTRLCPINGAFHCWYFNYAEPGLGLCVEQCWRLCHGLLGTLLWLCFEPLSSVLVAMPRTSIAHLQLAVGYFLQRLGYLALGFFGINFEYASGASNTEYLSLDTWALLA